MYIIFAYAVYVLLAVIASALIFGFCVAVIIVPEVIRIALRRLPGIIEAETQNLGLKSILLAFDGRAARNASDSCADGARS